MCRGKLSHLPLMWRKRLAFEVSLDRSRSVSCDDKAKPMTLTSNFRTKASTSKSGGVEGGRLYLRPVNLSDARGRYLAWLNDPEVTRFLRGRGQKHTAASLKQYLQHTLRDKQSKFFAIALKSSHRHIGNIKIGPIDALNRVAYVGILIGEKDCWNRGFATEAIRLVSQYAFATLKLHKLMAGCSVLNTGSARAFEKAGFTLEGTFRRQEWLDGQFVDTLQFGLLADEFQERQGKRGQDR